MADLALVDADQAVRMPDALSWEQGAMIEPAAVSWSAAKVGEVSSGDRVLVMGAGPIGALAALAASASGHELAIEASLAALRPGGRLVQTGLPVRPATIDLSRLMLHGLSIVGSVGYPLRCWPEVMAEVASGTLPIDRVMTGRVAMEDAVAGGFERLLDPAGDEIKILVDIGAGR